MYPPEPQFRLEEGARRPGVPVFKETTSENWAFGGARQIHV